MIKEMIEDQISWLTVNINNLKIDHPRNPQTLSNLDDVIFLAEECWQKKIGETKLSCMESEKKFLTLLLDTITQNK